jgi:hypothetical protein
MTNRKEAAIGSAKEKQLKGEKYDNRTTD